MKIRSLIRAALLSTTIFCAAGPAQAGPVAAFVGGFLNALGAGTLIAGHAAFLGAWTAGFNAAAFLAGGTLLSRLVVSIGLSAISSALTPKPRMPDPAEVMTNYAQDVSWVEYAYGRVRKGGPFALSAFSRAGATVSYPGVSGSVVEPAVARRHYGVLIAGHPTQGPVLHYFDKWQVELNAAKLVTTEPVNGRSRLRAYTGQAGQTVDPLWDAIFPEMGAGDNFKGLSYAALYADRPKDSDFADVYPSGREWNYSPVWDGWNEIYDPRTGLTGWSNNAALVIAHAAVNLFGKTLHWPEVALEADRCDELVVNRSGATQKRWTINTVLRSNMTWEEVRAHFQMCCDAFFYERRDGAMGFKVGYYSAPTLTLTARDFWSLNVKSKPTGPDEVGSYALRYVEPLRDWNQEVSGAIVSDPLGQRSEESCYGIDSHNQAWRVISRWSKTARPEWRISASLKPIGYECMEQRFIRVQHAELGLDQIFEIAMLSRIQGQHSFQIEIVSVEEGDFSPNALMLEPPRTQRQIIAEDGSIPAVGSLSATVINGAGGSALTELDWPTQPADLNQQIQFRAPASGVTEWQIVNAASGQSSFVLSGQIDGAEYQFQVRNRTPAGRLGEWAPVDPIVAVAIANTTPPGPFTSFAAAVVAATTAQLSFTAPNDPNYAGCRIYRGPSSTFSAAVLIHTEYGLRSDPDTYPDSGLSAGTYYYWAEPINGSGIPGTSSGPQSITII